MQVSVVIHHVFLVKGFGGRLGSERNFQIRSLTIVLGVKPTRLGGLP